MCAWKRGTQNNQPGEIRKGHIREFLIHATAKKDRITGKLHVVDAERFVDVFGDDCLYSATALVCSEKNGLPECFKSSVLNNTLYLHAHEYPRCVLTAVLSEDVPFGSIILNHAQRINNKVCSAEHQSWSIFRGDAAMYDCREASIGDHRVHMSSKPPATLKSMIVEVQCADLAILHGTQNERESSMSEINCVALARRFSRSLLQSVATVDDVLLVPMKCTGIERFIEIAGRVIEVHAALDDVINDDGDDVVDEKLDSVNSDCYRGFADEYTDIYIRLSPLQQQIQQMHNDRAPTVRFVSVREPPPPRAQKDIVHIYTNDGEFFPVKRRLLRPCIALTAVVQEGKGKYKQPASQAHCSSGGALSKSNAPNRHEDALDTTPGSSRSDEVTSTAIDVDACTFDRVLLYLEHEARGEDFRFDPLLANELREAAVTLGVMGLRDACDKVLGSFQERVRRTPIRLSEVMSRNSEGANAAEGGAGKRKETWLIMSGMVLDITRWLDEHPGGSTIIPEQALGVDCTVFFEIYHASRQSFLYLKEFYIGELALEDRDKVPLPSRSQAEGPGRRSDDGDGRASEAFMEQLHRITAPWRLNINEMNAFEVYKSF